MRAAGKKQRKKQWPYVTHTHVMNLFMFRASFTGVSVVWRRRICHVGLELLSFWGWQIGQAFSISSRAELWVQALPNFFPKRKENMQSLDLKVVQLLLTPGNEHMDTNIVEFRGTWGTSNRVSRVLAQVSGIMITGLSTIGNTSQRTEGCEALF